MNITGLNNETKSNETNLNNEKQDCCKKNNLREKKSFSAGIAYGLIPHLGCIAFIIGSTLGVTMLMQFFKPLLMNRYLFHMLILMSLMFATLSSFLYLRKNSFLSIFGVKRKWKYLAAMYGSTIGINLLLFMVIFPLLTNIPVSSSITGTAVGVGRGNANFSSLRLSVDIPCPGHAPLISNELKSIAGLIDVRFSFPNVFDVKYDSARTSRPKILSLDVFNTYKANVLSEFPVQQNNQ